jgi:oligopeptide transport system permease protein
MSAVPPYIPVAGDFSPARASHKAQELSRPSLSYWQDAWRRLKSNRRALASLAIVVFQVLAAVAGPLVWDVDPAFQDLDQISQGPTLGKRALIVAAYEEWTVPSRPDFPAEPDEFPDFLAAPAGLSLAAPGNSQAVRLVWEPVEGAAFYVVYRNEHEPEGPNDLGLPLGETEAGNQVGYEDRLQLEARTYYYSVLASDGIDEAEERATLAVQVEQAIVASQARRRGIEGEVGQRARLEPHPLGTDYLGRDMLARLIYGARTSLFIGMVGPFLYVLLGTLYGGFAGYLGGRVDIWLMRFADFVVALPFLLFMILFKIAFGIGPGESGVLPMLVALVLLGWPGTARLVRGQVLQLRQEPYVQAARLLGAQSTYLVLRHMIPNVMGVILVTLTFAVPSAIFTEAFLSFIGMGVAPPTPSWGSMCNEGIKTMLSHPHELVFPALCISVTVLAFNLLGDGLRDALDARMRSRQ